MPDKHSPGQLKDIRDKIDDIINGYGGLLEHEWSILILLRAVRKAVDARYRDLVPNKE